MASGGGIMALDLATTLGWAYASPEVVASWANDAAPLVKRRVIGVRSGSMKLAPTGAGNGEVGNRLLEWLDQQNLVFQPRELIIEAPLPGGQRDVNSAMRLFGLAFLAESYAFKRRWKFATVHNASVKKSITGSGAAKKPEVMSAIIGMGFEIIDDNQADAIACLIHWVMSRR